MSGKKLYVGNLKFSVSNDQLQQLFTSHGRVVNVNIIEGKGFGFVEMSSEDEAARAKESLDGQDFEGRVLRVDEARPPRKDRERRGGRERY
jgi:RNA recognition motif-containing protein